MLRDMPHWTEQQKLAIETRGRDVLVSAAAGSGKTSVLVERCFHLIAKAVPRGSLDRLLVVTFTDKAATEMRGRLRRRLREEGSAEPGDPHLKRQISLLDRAWISTIDAFCNRLLKDHFIEAGLDPGFNLIEGPPARTLQERVLDALFEELYASEDPAGERFRTLARIYGGKRGDDDLRAAILKAHGFLGTLRNPEAWFEAIRKKADDPSASAWMERLAPRVDEETAFCLRQFESIRTDSVRFGADAYAKHISLIVDRICEWRKELAAGLSDELYRAIRTYQFSRLPREDKNPTTETLHGRIDEAKKGMKATLLEKLCRDTPEDCTLMVQATGKHAAVLADLVRMFRERYGKAKRERGRVDFADMEALAYKVLREPDSSADEPQPSATARHFQDLFEHVLVDEYQDTNPLQDAIISLVSRSSDPTRPANRFLVGDVKQCIYGFRQADPTLFAGMYERFPHVPDSRRQRIDLQTNFRSRLGIVRGVNGLFERLMSRRLGGVPYDETSALVCGAAYPGDDDPEGPRVEFHLIEREVRFEESSEEDPGLLPSDLDLIEREGIAVAHRVLRMVGRKPFAGQPEFTVWDNAEKRVRPVEFRDIAILLRTTSQRGRFYARILEDFGIPLFPETKSDFFESTEVQDLFSLCQTLDNPRWDIPLASILRSPFFRFSEDELLAIRPVNRRVAGWETRPPSGDYWEALRKYADEGGDERLRGRCKDAVNTIDSWRGWFRSGPIAETLQRILDETEYRAYVEGLRGSDLRRAAVRQFLRLAADFPGGGERGGFRFVQMLRKMEEAEEDYGSAATLPSSENVVRLMSIHNSKGLEFPVVFVPDLGKQWNLSGDGPNLLLHPSEGIALPWMDPRRFLSRRTPIQEVLTETIRREILSEEMRILYVALTRARERLILSASVELSERLREWRSIPLEDPDLRDVSLLREKTAVDWLGPALLAHEDGRGLRDLAAEGDPAANSQTWRGSVYHVALHPEKVVAEWSKEYNHIRNRSSKGSLPTGTPRPAARSEDAEKVLERLRSKYPYERLTLLPAGRTVSEILREREDGTDRESVFEFSSSEWAPLPDPEKGSSGRPAAILRGSATHRFLQCLDLALEPSQENLELEAERMEKAGLLRPEERRAVSIGEIGRFFQTDIGRRILTGRDRVQRELEFVMAVPILDLEPDLPREWQEERILVRGVIDCLVDEPDGYLLIDYKTDRLDEDTLQEKVRFYGPQISIYAHAVEDLLKRKANECYLVFLSIGRNIRV
jgi:ATP-dependent helicase/nuclease subunit A